MTAARPTRIRRGLTLLELLIALSITGLTGLAVAGVITAVARGVGSISDGRSAVQRAHAAHARLRAYTEPALALLACDPARGIALWLHDDRRNGRVNLSELRVFWFDREARTITVERVQFPADWPPAWIEQSDGVLALIDDPFAVMLTQRAMGRTRRDVLADGIAEWSLATNAPDPRDANRLRLTLGVVAGWNTHDHQPEDALLTFGLANYFRPR
ncbi:MAG: hypothetical protein IBJ11_06325 [Phycisphaerales bacterium]|nr:hypothetical protein [Phycisphaerales bacterium]